MYTHIYIMHACLFYHNCNASNSQLIKFCLTKEKPLYQIPKKKNHYIITRQKISARVTEKTQSYSINPCLILGIPQPHLIHTHKKEVCFIFWVSRLILSALFPSQIISYHQPHKSSILQLASSQILILNIN